MKTDYWKEGDQVFVHYGKRYGVTATARTICMGTVEDAADTVIAIDNALQQGAGMGVMAVKGSLIPPTQNVTDSCMVCGDKILFKRADSRFCSSRCRQQHYRDSRKAMQLELTAI